MTALLKVFRIAIGLLLVSAAQAYSQDVKVHVLQSRPYSSADTTGLLHAPAHLTAVSDAGIQRGVAECAAHLRDPASNIDFRLITSFSKSSMRTSGDTVFTYRSTYGDYAATPATAYGLQRGEFVRVDCSRDRPVGRARGSNAPSPK